MPPRKLFGQIDERRIAGFHVEADALQFHPDGDCRLCDVKVAGDRSHRCWRTVRKPIPAAPPTSWAYDLGMLAKAAGLSLARLQAHIERGVFDPADLRSVVQYLEARRVVRTSGFDHKVTE